MFVCTCICMYGFAYQTIIFQIFQILFIIWDSTLTADNSDTESFFNYMKQFKIDLQNNTFAQTK